MEYDCVGWPIFCTFKLAWEVEVERHANTIDFHELLIIRSAILVSIIVVDISVVPVHAILRLIFRLFSLSNKITKPAMLVSSIWKRSRLRTRRKGRP